MQKGKVFVEKPDILDQISESQDPRRQYSLRDRSISTYVSIGDEASRRSQAALENNRQLRLEQYNTQAQLTESIMKANIQKSIRKDIDKKEKRFNELTQDIESAKSLIKTVDKSLLLQNEANNNKVRRQFDEWNNTVHGQIQGNISSQVNGMDYKEINKKRNEDFQKYLDITNRKAAIFRDIIIESEYDPLEPNRRSVKAVTGKLKKPTNIPLQKREEEMSMLVSGSGGGSAVRQGGSIMKYTLPVELWASGKIEATPHGNFAKMMDETRRDK
eukprot:gene49821-66738_t